MTTGNANETTTATEKTELIATGRRYLDGAPSVAYSDNPKLAGWYGKGINVCADCAERILQRGCDLMSIVHMPIWKPETLRCDLCSRTTTEGNRT